MKKKLLSIVLVALTSMLFSCDENVESESNSGDVILNEDIDILFNENYQSIKKLSEVPTIEQLMYDEEVFGSFTGKYQELYKNNVLDNNLKDGQVGENDDAKYIFYNDDTMRFVNRSEGYAVNLKTDTTYVGDFSVGACRSKLYNKDTTLSISKEVGKNPYDKWKTYRDSWIIRYLNNPEYLKDNNLAYTSDPVIDSNSILNDYLVTVFSIEIKNPGNIKKNFYNFATIRDVYDFKGDVFYTFVMKSTSDRTADFVNMIKSFELIHSKGKPSNQLNNMEVKYEENWDEATKKYYDKFISQERTDWGFYTSGLEQKNIVEAKLGALEEAMDYSFELMPTYQHVLSSGSPSKFALQNTIDLASGNGFNGKKVLHYTYQFTGNNNDVYGDDLYTPLFDVLRGPNPNGDTFFDKRNLINQAFTNIAEAFKSYKEPILFRLNNEMNTDWTSYCGMMTLNDPDIFIATWRYLYNFFIEQGVTNTIWIFNPVATSTPYSNWGEDMAYFPGNDYVHALGLTWYEDNNNGKVNSLTFRKDYTNYYNKNNKTWNKFPWIISEFGCGAGGDASGVRFRHASSQADYVIGMFDDFEDRANNPYLQNIKAAIWFNVNDSSNGKITNQYEIVIDKLPQTVLEFKEGLKINK
ncbi:MAG: hypothetical protein IJZ77_03270 [Bacilli bacterium]|nr:hypothetical protein [Bacilli bacterium]